MSVDPDVQAAFGSHDWQRVVDLFEARSEGLNADELLVLGDALYWTGRFGDAVSALESAVGQFAADGRRAEAGAIAGILSYLAFRRQAPAVAVGWLKQAEGLLHGEPESLGHMWVALLYIGKALFADGDIDRALRLGDDAIAVSSRTESRSGQSLAMSFKAIASIQKGDWREAIEMLDESAAMAVTGDDLRVTSDVYCNTISTCRNLGDYRRAGQWTEQADRWMKANGVSGYTGACQVHRAELKRMHGLWEEAEREARHACQELERFQITDYLGTAHYEIGEVRRRMGDLDAAQASFDKAYENGHDGQPGRALLQMDRGDVDGAFESISAALGRIRFDSSNKLERGPSRARLLPVFVELALKTGDIGAAGDALEQLEGIADGYESHVWRATAKALRGELQVLNDDPDAVTNLEEAARMWRDLDLPYELARTRVLLGEAKRQTGDQQGADLDQQSALAILKELGAATDIERLERQLGSTPATRPTGSRVTRTFMFTDIVTSTDLIGLIGDDRWQDLLKWHDRTLRRIVDSNTGEVVRSTGDGVFAAFDQTRPAIDCAVDIQRTLTNHRREAGFAPQIRIGLHRAEATKDGTDYSGAGIHLAARIGDYANADQIVISQATLAEAHAIPYPVGKKETADLKGIKEPVQLQTINWHAEAEPRP